MNSLLSLVAITLGLIITIKHLCTLFFPDYFKKLAKSFPRSRSWGTFFLFIAAAWAFILAATIDLGEFSSFRYLILMGIVASSILFWFFVPEFLAVRSLGFLALLAAKPLLDLTFLRSGLLPIMLSLLAYIWVIGGLFFVGMPYLLRNLITTITAPERTQLWKQLSLLGMAYGLALVIGGLWMFFQN